MAQAEMPMLDRLMTSGNSAWLWDGARARIVWANPAGIAFFGGETLFDLIDMVFDARSDAVRRIGELGGSLRRGEDSSETLTFAGAAGIEAVACRCVLHALADGRDGVLVMAAGPEAATVGSTYFDGLLAALPMAVAIADEGGTIVLANAAARSLAGERGTAMLADLLGDAALASDLVAAAAAAGAATRVRSLCGALGWRDYRISLRRMDAGEGDETPSYLLLAEDVTERRRLERRLSGLDEAGDAANTPSTPLRGQSGARRLSAEEAQAFARLGDDLARGDGAAAPPAPSGPPPRPRARVPDLIRRALDSRSEPILVYRDDAVMCANHALAQLLGHASAADVQDRADLVAVVSAAADGARLELAGADGSTIKVNVRHQTFPWNTGPVPMAILTSVATEEGAAVTAEAPAAEARAPDDDVRAIPATASEPAPPAPLEEPPIAAVMEEVRHEPGGEGNDGFAMPADELRNILDTASDGIITLDGSGHILGFSAGAEAIFGYGEDEVDGKPLIDLLTTASRRIVRDYLSAFDNGGMASVFNDGREIEAVVKQGGTVPLFITIGQMAAPTAATGARRRRPAFCVVVRDITQWKTTESELRRAKEEAERASRQKSEFLANISHELRTPLNAILGFSDVMRSERFGEMRNERYRGYSNDIHTSGEHLLSLINDLLDLSKVEAGKLELNFTSVNLANLVDEVIALLQDQATAARVVLRKSVSSGIPNVVADLRSIKQILLNLVSNAIKFTDPGGQVILSLKLMKSGELALSVKDTGIGMSEAELSRALEPFQRIERAGRQEQPGTGLGLPLTRALAEANRTRFAIKSEPKRGTLVEITFPVPRVLA